MVWGRCYVAVWRGEWEVGGSGGLRGVEGEEVGGRGVGQARKSSILSLVISFVWLVGVSVTLMIGGEVARLQQRA
jgi:hypothetical protein